MEKLEIEKGELKREIKGIVVHCSATKEYKPFNLKEIESMHARKFKRIGGCCCGYHFLVYLDGKIVQTKKLQFIGQHTAGYNQNTIAVCYIGGLSAMGAAKDTRTMAQKQSLEKLLIKLKELFPSATIKGHRDYSPDKNKNGKIEKSEWLKDCPCFNAQTEYERIK